MNTQQTAQQTAQQTDSVAHVKAIIDDNLDQLDAITFLVALSYAGAGGNVEKEVDLGACWDAMTPAQRVEVCEIISERPDALAAFEQHLGAVDAALEATFS